MEVQLEGGPSTRGKGSAAALQLAGSEHRSELFVPASFEMWHS